MSAGYTKLFSSLVTSTVWREPDHVRLVWITMLAIADADGEVEASVPGLADLARVSLENCVQALDVLLAPDEWSRTQDHDGRRIEPMDGGWRLLNHAKYRHKASPDAEREKAAARKRRQRQRERDSHDVTRDVTKSRVQSRQAEAEAEAEADRDLTHTPRARACVEAPLPEPPEDLPDRSEPAPVERLILRLATERYEKTYATPWAHGRYWQDIQDLAVWVTGVCEKHPSVTPEVVVRQVLDGFFADTWAAEREHPFGALAKSPHRYAKAGERLRASAQPRARKGAA